MPTTYAAYSNLSAGANSMPSSTEQTPKATPRGSVDSTASAEVKKASRWARFVDQLKPLETPQEPIGFFTPIPPYGVGQKKPVKDENSKSHRASKAYENFKVFVGGPRVGDL